MTSMVHFKSRDGDRNPVRGNRALIGFGVVTIGIGIVPLLDSGRWFFNVCCRTPGVLPQAVFYDPFGQAIPSG